MEKLLAILKNNKKSITVTKKLINQWLGAEKFDYGRKEKKDQVGTVTGLAYTSFGGDILQVEVTHFEGKGTYNENYGKYVSRLQSVRRIKY